MTTATTGAKAWLPGDGDAYARFMRGASFASWRDAVRSVAGCARPVRLSGSSSVVDATGAGLTAVEGSVLVPCNNRRAAVCEPCSARYAVDTFHLVRAGLAGGKGVPESVAGHVRAFVTLTAPSFGPVHNQPTTASGASRRCGCGERHHDSDPRLGTPLDPSTYDYTGAVLWQAHSTELWRRFTITTARHLASALGMRVTELRRRVRISYTKVAEYQRRGLVHFHAVVRLDGPDGPDTPPPAAATVELLTHVVRSAAAAVQVRTPHDATVPARTIGWGAQVDIAPIAADAPDDAADVVRDGRVAGYVAKYATKGTGATVGADTRIRRAEAIEDLHVSEHHKAMMRTAWHLGGLDAFEPLNLRKWAHMLGFRGHFLTKSRRYSTTFTAIRSARGQHRQAQRLAELGITDTDTVTVINDWTMTGIGYHTDVERELAAAIAGRRRPPQAA